ncbi:MAG: NlpC/P60 family protein [Anaerolineales bacterium]
MIQTIQNQLNELATTYNNRTSVFDISIVHYTDKKLALSGRVLEQSQVDEIKRIFPTLQVDTSTIKILNRPSLPCLTVATNLTGLYEKPTFGMPLSNELYFGTTLEILDEEDRWAFTRQKDGYLGWVYKAYLTDKPVKPVTHLCLAPAIELRAQPKADSEIISRLVSGTGVHVEKTRGEWSYVIANQIGWIPSHMLRSLKEIPDSLKEKCELLIEDSARMIGTPYLWGGTTGNGIDCSGFARLLHRWIGIEIPRDADMQWAAAHPIEEPYQVGDLFFFGEGDSDRRISHVAISLGGWQIIHSSRGNNGVYIDNLLEKEGLKRIFVSAGSFLR